MRMTAMFLVIMSSFDGEQEPGSNGSDRSAFRWFAAALSSEEAPAKIIF
jgi:hypothetical protein